MICFNCGEDVGGAQTCPNCGTDLHIIQRAIQVSNVYYNDGLQKAQVRNLSGAIISLKSCLKINKYHIDARNLLGLVYYEIGEAVDALSEWVISKSYQPFDNMASTYLEAIQSNPSQLTTINQTIKKYNQALVYCKQNSRDLAIIQLKKVLTLNPKLVKGHQLLALLYIQDGRLEQAKKELRAAGKIDTDNTRTLRYLKEVNALIRESHPNKKKDMSDDLISYQSGNEMIIMPKRFKESSIGGTILAIAIGLLVGASVIGFLVVPNVRKRAQNAANQKLLEVNDSLTTAQQTISDLEVKIEELQQDVADAQDLSQKGDERIATYEQMVYAYSLYMNGEILEAGKILDEMDSSNLSKDSLEIYDELKVQMNEEYYELLYNEGCQAFYANDYATAMTNLLTVVEAFEDYDGGNAAYYLALSYRELEDMEAARPYFEYVIENYPGSQRAQAAEVYLQEQQPQEPQQ